MERKKLLLTTDILLIAGFAATAVSGLQLHIGSENMRRGFRGESSPELSEIHAVSAALFLLVTCIHIYMHRGWFKQLFTSVRNKSILTIITAVIFSLTVLTVILGLEHLHVKLGELLIPVGAIHIISRLKIFAGLFKNKTVEADK